jgi:hypothetical protein
MNDLAGDYSIKKWLLSNRRVFWSVVAPVRVAVPLFLAFEWLRSSAETRIPIVEIKLSDQGEYRQLGYEVRMIEGFSDRLFLVIRRLPEYPGALWKGLVLGMFLGVWSVICSGRGERGSDDVSYGKSSDTVS